MVKNQCETEKPKKDIPSTQSREISKFLAQHDVVVEYLCCLLKDCYTLLPTDGKFDFERDRNTIRVRFAHEGLSFATKTLPSFFDSLLTYLETGVSVYPSFKMRRGCSYPVFLQRLVAPIYERPSGDSTALYMKCLYQLLVPFKKLKGPYKQRVLAHELSEFINVDNNLPKEWEVMQDATASKSIAQLAEALVGEVIEGLNPFDLSQSDQFRPRPGPGATNTPTEKHERFRPHVFYTTLNENFPYDEWYAQTPQREQRNRWDLRVWPMRKAPFDINAMECKYAPTSRFKFVHKTYGKPRCICIEELEMQWLQQGIRNALYKRIENSPLTKGYVEFTDQSVNASLALNASSDLEFATIDMSAASDRVPRWLVERLFSGNSELCNALMTCSTRIIELPKRPDKCYPGWIEPKKFAPMGSALCFPVMGLVHWALIRSIVLLYGPPHSDKRVWVYGDDIIVSSQLAHLVYKYLPLFGMKLNVGKSFVNSRFRESCGTHAYNGVDITPTRFKTVVKFPPKDEDLVSALINESDLFRKGFRYTAALIRQQILNLKAFGAETFPTVERESTVLGWIRDRGAVDVSVLLDAPSRWNADLQCFEYKVRVVHSVFDKSPLLDDVDGYLRSLLLETRSSTSIKKKEGKLCVTEENTAQDVGGIPIGLQVRRKWLTIPACEGLLLKQS